jgi:transcriptional antiterminator RfaH
MVAVPLASVPPFLPAPAEETRPRILRPLLDACGLGWFCLRAAGRREHLAALNLARRNSIEAFAPRIRVRREIRTGGVRTVTEALFPGYLFARFHYPAQVRHVVSTSDVRGLVAFGGIPPRLDDTTIAHLRLQTPPATCLPLSPVFEEGDWVRVAAGCLRGTEGRVCAPPAGGDRVCVLLCLLGHEVEISLPGAQLINRIGAPELPSASWRDSSASPATHFG